MINISKIFTIGHSNQSIDSYLSILELNKINCIVDIRSRPYSKYVNQFNKENLEKFLRNKHIKYIFMGKELGAKRNEKILYAKEGYLDFDKFSNTQIFISGIQRIKIGIEKGYRIAIMCTEKEPLDCHRTLLIARILYKEGYEVLNILENGEIKTQDCIEKELLDIHYPNRMQQDFFNNFQENNSNLIEEAYKLQNRKKGFKLENK